MHTVLCGTLSTPATHVQDGQSSFRTRVRKRIGNCKLVMVTHLYVMRAFTIVTLSTATAVTFIIQNGRGKRRGIYLIWLGKGPGKTIPLAKFLTYFWGSAAIKSANSLRQIGYLIRLKQRCKSPHVSYELRRPTTRKIKNN